MTTVEERDEARSIAMGLYWAVVQDDEQRVADWLTIAANASEKWEGYS